MAKNASESTLVKILNQELAALEGIQSQHPDTGAGIESGSSYISQYTNRLFGAPFQLMDSVDRRFSGVNTEVGNEYLRNFLLNSPILHIKPGMAKYTGGATSNQLVASIKEMYIGTNTGNMSASSSMLEQMASNTIFKSGSRLQKRMFGFRENYWEYMSYVNYMCRSMAVFLDLVSNSKYPHGTLTNGHSTIESFGSMNWQNYRMLKSSSSSWTPWSQLSQMHKATVVGAGVQSFGTAVKDVLGVGVTSVKEAASAVGSSILGQGSFGNNIKQAFSNIGSSISGAANDIVDTTMSNFSYANNTSVIEVIEDKVCSVMFMVEPVQFEETYTNTAEDSAIESTLDSLNNEIGQEIAFITNSNVDMGNLEGITSFLGSTTSAASSFLDGLVNKVAGGGFASNLFSGAIGSIKGQKMIYPKIYKKSESRMDYNFTINLTSPYGDVYNYYMNIVVPLMHLIALAAPRMVTANSISSPFLVQAYIPGMCTCQLGIISNMTVRKNPSMKHVSVNGYPLDVQVQFTVQELYNAMAISPSNDPASFLFNECLNDYLANLAGLQPSVDTYTNQRLVMFNGVEQYFQGSDSNFMTKDDEWLNDLANQRLQEEEEFFNPFISNGS